MLELAQLVLAQAVLLPAALHLMAQNLLYGPGPAARRAPRR